MRRVFKNPAVQDVYDSFMEQRPENVGEALAQAFCIGYQNPDESPVPALCGAAGSVARAAWAAGVDSRRADSKKGIAPPCDARSLTAR
jgi:hypothetical protein